MTDKEIKSAMEACLNRTDRCVCTIEDCPYAWEDECSIDLWKDALDLINRQQAEIEKLNTACILTVDIKLDENEIREQLEKIKTQKMICVDNTESIRAKAIKEFKCNLIEQIEYIEDAHQREYKDDFGKGWTAGFNSATHLIKGAIDYIAGFENRGADDET